MAKELSELQPGRLADYFEYLDALRESGITNMYGASPYLARAHRLPNDTAVTVLKAWMHTFDKSPALDRANAALAKAAA